MINNAPFCRWLSLTYSIINRYIGKVLGNAIGHDGCKLKSKLQNIEMDLFRKK